MRKRTGDQVKVTLIAATFLALASGLLAQAPPIAFDRQITNGGGSFGIMRPFGVAAIACRSDSGREPATIADVLGPSVKALTVRAYDTTRFGTKEEVRDYVRAMLTAHPESDQLATFQAWSEGGSIQVVIVSEWMDGRFGRLDLGSLGAGAGNQYAHLEDPRGCERWGRFQARAISCVHAAAQFLAPNRPRANGIGSSGKNEGSELPNIQMEPTRSAVRVMMSRTRAAHLAR